MPSRGPLHHGKAQAPADPNHPHPFRLPGDHWVARGVPPANLAGSPDTSMAAGTTYAALQFADQRCAVCRRERSDPIHAPED